MERFLSSYSDILTDQNRRVRGRALFCFYYRPDYLWDEKKKKSTRIIKMLNCTPIFALYMGMVK